MNRKPGSVPAFWLTTVRLVTAIYLEQALRPASLQSTRSIGRTALPLLDFAPDEVCHQYCYQYRGGLLPRPFTFTGRINRQAVYFLLHFLS